MKCDIIIPVWNNLSYTRDCIEHIEKNTLYPYRLIIVDNASDKPTAEYCNAVAARRDIEVILITNGENLGFIRAVNQGLKASSAPYVCVMNNDTVPAPGWLERMVAFAESHPDAGLINPQCNGHGNIPLDIYARSLLKRAGEYMEMNQCQGFAMLVRRELIEKIGILDEEYGIGGYDDTDYSMRAHRAGYRSVSIGDAYVYHRQHASFDRSGDREQWVRRNREIYYKKWGRHLRVGVAVALEPGDLQAIDSALAFVYGLAREWSWVHFWVISSATKAEIVRAVDAVRRRAGLPPHQNIRLERLVAPASFADGMIAVKYIERLLPAKRDKAFDAFIVLGTTQMFLAGAAARLVGSAVVRVPFSAAANDLEKIGKDTAVRLAAMLRDRVKGTHAVAM